MKKDDNFEDDGSVVADMSEIERPRSVFDLFPHKPKSNASNKGELPQENISGEEKRKFVQMALLSALLIALAFAVGLGVIILIMYLVW